MYGHTKLLGRLLFLIAVLTGVVAYFLVKTPLKTSSQAAETQVCGMSLNISAQEERIDGRVVPLSFAAHRELDPIKWGFSDTINRPPYTELPIITHFDDQQTARYSTFVGELSFVPFPKQSQIYPSEQNADVQLAFQDDVYDIVRREIRRCSLIGSSKWLCAEPQTDTRIVRIPVRCGMDLDFGWVVKKRSESVSRVHELSGSVPNISPDINGDGVVNVLDLSIVIGAYGSNDPQADLNKDGRVNGLDYSVLVQLVITS